MIYKQEKEEQFKAQVDKIQSIKKGHVETKEILSSITKTLEKDVLLPLNSVAFVRAKIYHTNETLVVLGDDYFVERSAHQAIEILQRRIDVLDDGIRKIYLDHEENKDLGVKLPMEDGSIEIIEPYEEEEESMEAKLEAKFKETERLIASKKANMQPEPRKENDKIKTQEERKDVKAETVHEQTAETNATKTEKKRVSFSEEVQTKELPKKVSKFKQEMMDKRQNK